MSLNYSKEKILVERKIEFCDSEMFDKPIKETIKYLQGMAKYYKDKEDFRLEYASYEYDYETTEYFFTYKELETDEEFESRQKQVASAELNMKYTIWIKDSHELNTSYLTKNAAINMASSYTETEGYSTYVQDINTGKVVATFEGTAG